MIESYFGSKIGNKFKSTNKKTLNVDSFSSFSNLAKNLSYGKVIVTPSLGYKKQGFESPYIKFIGGELDFEGKFITDSIFKFREIYQIPPFLKKVLDISKNSKLIEHDSVEKFVKKYLGYDKLPDDLDDSNRFRVLPTLIKRINSLESILNPSETSIEVNGKNLRQVLDLGGDLEFIRDEINNFAYGNLEAFY